MGNLLNLELIKAENDLAQFLIEHPHMMQYQEELNIAMDKQPDSTARMYVIVHYLRWNLHKLEDINKELIDDNSNRRESQSTPS